MLLAGTKNVRSDTDWLIRTGWRKSLDSYVEAGGRLAGICGGYQMLGRVIRDPEAIEGPPGKTRALAYLDVATTLRSPKVLTRTTAVHEASGETVSGYEIHNGVTEVLSAASHVLSIRSRNGRTVHEKDGAASPDGRVWGCYLHGLFDSPGIRRALLSDLRPDLEGVIDTGDRLETGDLKESHYEAIAEHFAAHLDLGRIFSAVGLTAFDE